VSGCGCHREDEQGKVVKGNTRSKEEEEETGDKVRA
jgi:hypothetical protein